MFKTDKSKDQVFKILNWIQVVLEIKRFKQNCHKSIVQLEHDKKHLVMQTNTEHYYNLQCLLKDYASKACLIKC